jgi:tetratricopeptide (TPR) repeat protein
MTKFSFTTLLVLLFVLQSFAQQNLPILRVSPQAEVSQNIATFAKITINYSRPAVNGRQIWGNVVPYGLAPNAFGNGKDMPWRAGANETTVITFSHDVKIEGMDLKAGSYGLHMLPSENDVTIIFNANSRSWGSFFLNSDEDVLRVKVKWLDAPHMERLQYTFENISNNSATAYLRWEKKKIGFKIEVDRDDVILATYRYQLSNLPGFNSAAWASAANYCLQNNTHIDEANAWIEKALSMNGGQSFPNNRIKADLLRLAGKEKEADQIFAAALENATEAELNNYGYLLLFSNPPKIDDALKYFKLNVERFPDSWNVYDSYAEALNSQGKKDAAREYYLKALERAPEVQRSRIEGIINSL